MKGRTKVRSPPVGPAPPDDGTGNIAGRYSIFDFQGVDNSLPIRRYTIAELAQRLLILAVFESEFSCIVASFILLISCKQKILAFLQLFASNAFAWLLAVRALHVPRTAHV